jgi:hypothetical protein
MSNEILFFGLLFFSLALPMISYWFGRSWIYVFVGVNACAILPMSALSADVFGYSVSLGTIYYASLFLATDLLAETYGKKAAYQAVIINIIVSYVLVGLFQIPLALEASEASLEFHAQLQAVYAHSWKMVIWGTICFAITQLIDVNVYNFLHEKTGNKHLWLRNNVSSITSAIFANLFFWYFALGDVVDDWFASAIAGFLLTAFVNLCDTPFMYLAKTRKPLDLKQTN